MVKPSQMSLKSTLSPDVPIFKSSSTILYLLNKRLLKEEHCFLYLSSSNSYQNMYIEKFWILCKNKNDHLTSTRSLKPKQDWVKSKVDRVNDLRLGDIFLDLLKVHATHHLTDWVENWGRSTTQILQRVRSDLKWDRRGLLLGKLITPGNDEFLTDNIRRFELVM